MEAAYRMLMIDARISERRLVGGKSTFCVRCAQIEQRFHVKVDEKAVLTNWLHCGEIESHGAWPSDGRISTAA